MNQTIIETRDFNFSQTIVERFKEIAENQRLMSEWMRTYAGFESKEEPHFASGMKGYATAIDLASGHIFTFTPGIKRFDFHDVRLVGQYDPDRILIVELPSGLIPKKLVHLSPFDADLVKSICGDHKLPHLIVQIDPNLPTHSRRSPSLTWGTAPA